MEMLDLFCSMFGIVVVDLVLMLGVFGGIYIGGGVVLYLGEYFVCLFFCVCFENKGCMLVLIKVILIYVIMVEYLVFMGVLVIFVDWLDLYE